MPPNAMQIAKLKYVCIMSCCLTCANYHLNQHRLVCRAGKSITHMLLWRHQLTTGCLYLSSLHSTSVLWDQEPNGTFVHSCFRSHHNTITITNSVYVRMLYR